MTDKSPPFSLESEQSVLGGILLDPCTLDSASEMLSAGDFYQTRHRIVFTAMLDLAKRDETIDIITITNELQRADKMEQAGGAAYVCSLPDLTPTAAHVDSYAKIVKAKSQVRQVIVVAQNISELGYGDPESIDDYLDETASSIFEACLDSTNNGVRSAMSVVVESFKAIQQIKRGKRSGLSTGYFEIDRLLGGLHSGNVIVMAARPGMGKTALALNIAAKIATNGRGVLFFSLEMSTEALGIRLLCYLTKLDTADIARGNISEDDEMAYFKASQVIQHWPLYIDDAAGQTPFSIRSTSRRMVLQHNIKLIIVDYLQLMTGKRTKDSIREQEIADISRSLKALAKELGLPIIVLSQLNRQVEQRENQRPRLSDLRESGAIEQDADVVMFLYKPKGDEFTSIIGVDIAKHRNGPTGTLFLTFLDNCMRFENHREEANNGSS